MKIDTLTTRILKFGEKINKLKFRPYQWKKAKQLVRAVILHEPGTFTTLWCRKSGKTLMLKAVMLTLMTLLPEIAKTALSKDFPRLKLYRDGIKIAFAGPKLETAKLPFINLRRQARQKIFLEVLSSLDLEVITSNSINFELSNRSTATAFSGSETAANEGPEAHCLDGETIIITDHGQIKISELVSRYRHGEKFKVLSLGKTGINFQNCLNVSSEFKDQILKIFFSDGKILILSYEHPININGQYCQAQNLKIGDKVCKINNSKLFSDQHSVTDISEKMELSNFLTDLNRKNICFGSISNYQICAINLLRKIKMVDGGVLHGNLLPKFYQKVKNSGVNYIQKVLKLFQETFWTDLHHWGYASGGKMTEAIATETVSYTPNVLPLMNIKYSKNTLVINGKLKQQLEIVKNETKNIISLIFQKFHFYIYHKLSNLIFFQCLGIKSESPKNVKSVAKIYSVEDGLAVQSNVKKKENVNTIWNYAYRNVKLLRISVKSVVKNLRVLKIILQKLVQLDVISSKKINYLETGDLKKESLLNQEVRIIQIERLNQGRELFDLMVEENHNYFANGILVHNCLIVDEASLLSAFSLYKILRPMIASNDGLISETGTPGRKKCPFLSDIDYNKRKMPELHQEIPYSGVIPFSKDYASFIQSEINRLPGGEKNPFFRMNYLLEWLIAEGHFVDFKKFMKLATGERGKQKGGRLAAGVDWGKITSATTITILEERENLSSAIDLLEIKGDWDYQFEYIVPFLKNYNLDAVFSESTGSGDPLTTRLSSELGANLVHHKFMSAQYKDKIFTNFQTDLDAEIPRFEYFEDDTPESQSFIQQFLDAEQEVKGKLLIVHKPEGDTPTEGVSADDFLFSTALAHDALQSAPAPVIEYQTASKKREIISKMADF